MDGSPFECTDGQAEIVEVISTRGQSVGFNRIHCMTYTQYGKSDNVSIGVLNRVSTYPEKWSIVAPSSKKARIIMSFLIGHIFDNEYTLSKFLPDEKESYEDIRRHRNKDRINFKHSDNTLGEVFITTAEGKRTKDFLDALLGFGAPNVVIDESSLLDDPVYAGVKRMIGGSTDNFLFEIGNPMRRNHFLKSSRDPIYYKINIPYQQGIKEGRIAQEYVEEMRKEAFFEQLYENEFPKADAIDSSGYVALITDIELDMKLRDNIEFFGTPRLGCDPAGEGSNKSVIALRTRNGASVVYDENQPDTMTFAAMIIKALKKYKIKAEDVFIDKDGIGKGVFDRVREAGYEVTGVSNGGEADNKEQYANKRAEMYMRTRDWLLSVGQLKRHSGWDDLLDIRYKVMSERKIKMKSKIDMLKDGIQSPDHADALALTFAAEERPETDKQAMRVVQDDPISEYEER